MRNYYLMRIFYLLLALAHFGIMMLLCFWQTDYGEWIDDTFGDYSIFPRFYSAISFIISMGFFRKAKGEPFHNFMLSSRRRRPSATGLSNVDDFLAYRNSIMGGMSPEKAARLMMDTSIVDAISSGAYQGSNTRDTAEYINSMLGGLSPSNQIKFLRNRR